jgi:hypothetical protein
MSFRHWSHRALTPVLLGLMVARASTALAQGKDSAATKVVTPQLDFSGVIFGNYNYRTDSLSKAQNGGNSPNAFTIERAYLTFRMPVGDNASIRVTTDISQGDQSTTSFYRGWFVRLKYGYLQYTFLNGAGAAVGQRTGGNEGFSLLGRIGMLHTVVVDYMEGFFPRYLSQTAAERNGFFSSADLGAALLLTLPNKWGEIYGTVTNGPGYTAAETDRFKDFAVRLSLTPAGNTTGIFKTFAITPWYYKGFTASQFQNGGANQVGKVTDGLTRDRYGIFVGNKDRRFTFGAEYGERTETVETGANTTASPRVATDVTGKLMDGFVLLRPFEFADAKTQSPFGLIGRIDDFKPNDTRDPHNRTLIAGVFWDLTKRATLALDYQGLARQSGSTTPETKTWYVHWQATF